jgi:hypothetical protein
VDALRGLQLSVAQPSRPTRTSTFPGQRKVDFHRFFVETRLKCLRKSVSQRPLSAAGVVAGALPCFVFQLFAELNLFKMARAPLSFTCSVEGLNHR